MATNFYFVPARTTGHENPVLNGYRFYKDRIRDDKYYWKCCCCKTHGCKARIQTLDRQLISPIPEHKHDLHHAGTEVHKAKQSLKRRAAESDLPTKFLASEVPKGMYQKARAKVGCHPSSLTRMARRSRQASKRHPANPRITQPIHAAVHGVFPNGWHHPICYGLLPGKTTVLYKNLLATIDTFDPFQPQSVQCDYEIGIHNAIAEVWPSLTRRGCNFHHKKSLWKHLQQLDLVEEYAVPGSDIRKYFKMMGALAFVPEDDVRRVWRLLKPLIPDDMLQVVSYYETTWIGTSAADPLFSLDLWNFDDSTLMLLPTQH